MASESEKRKHIFKHLNMKLKRRQRLGCLGLQDSCLVHFFLKEDIGVISETSREDSFEWEVEHTRREGQMDGIKCTAVINEASITVCISLLNSYMSLFIILIYFLFIKLKDALKFYIFFFQIMLVFYILRTY